MFVVNECRLIEYPSIKGGVNKYPSVGRSFGVETWEDAVNLAIKLVREKSGEDESEEEYIRHELESDTDYADLNGEWSVCITTLDSPEIDLDKLKIMN
jgi:hypothetical protein